MKIPSWIRRRKAAALAKRYFDEDFYLREYPAKAHGKNSAFKHFMSVGWRLGCDPNNWFRVNDYLRANPDVALAGINPFIHFLTHGQRENRPITSRAIREAGGGKTAGAWSRAALPPELLEEVAKVEKSGYFSARYYLDAHKDLDPLSIDAAVHYCEWGWREGRNPSKVFDISYLGELFPKFRRPQKNPIIDFIESGLENTFAPNLMGMSKIPLVESSSKADWISLRPCISDSTVAVDIIVPVYRGREETLRCVYSVLSSKIEAIANLVVIDDCSPDIELSETLLELKEAGLFTLLVNETNLGFVKTVNKGLRLHPDRDVVILNSDTEVYDRWLDRILSHAVSDKQIATVTPLSNNATICSYPETLCNNEWGLEIPGPEIDKIASEINSGIRVEVPTGVGFCMYMRREAIRQVGDLDESAFDKGYGEENDFCLRAAEAGWRNVMALDIYVRHHGEVSFGAGSGIAQSKGLTALKKKHPAYLNHVDRYIKGDSARPGRVRLDAARIKTGLGEIALFFSHNSGGGIERHIRDLRANLREEGVEVLVLRPSGRKAEHVSFDTDGRFFTPNLQRLHINADADLLAQIIHILSPRFIHVHSLVGLHPTARNGAMKLVRDSGVPYFFTFHDYSPICPHAQFVDPTGSYCGEPGPEVCQTCVNRYPPADGWSNVRAYQTEYRDFLRAAKRIIAPSRDTADRANAFLGAQACEVIPHRDVVTVSASVSGRIKLSSSARAKSATRVAFVGAIGPHKGREIMELCALDSDSRNLSLYFCLVGYSDGGSAVSPKLTVTGEYRNDNECLTLLKEYQPHFVAFFSIWPETYSYALSLAFRANVPPVVFNIGAMAERVRVAGFGHCIPHEWRDKPSQINDFLIANPLPPMSEPRHRSLLRAMEEQSPRKLLSEVYIGSVQNRPCAISDWT